MYIYIYLYKYTHTHTHARTHTQAHFAILEFLQETAVEAALADNGSLVARDSVHVMAATSCMPVLGGGLSRISPDVGSGKNGRLPQGVKNESAGGGGGVDS